MCANPISLPTVLMDSAFALKWMMYFPTCCVNVPCLRRVTPGSDQIFHMCEESLKFFCSNICSTSCRVSKYSLNLDRRIPNNLGEA